MLPFAKAGEKSVFAGLFGGSTSDSDSDSEGSNGQGGSGSANLLHDRELEGEATELVHRSESIRGAFEVRLVQRKIKGIAHQLWPAATHLCRYIDANLDTVFSAYGGLENCRAIELGAGIGLVGVYLAALGCKRVVLTDLPEAMELLQTNSGVNDCAGAAAAMPLCWGNASETEAALSAALPAESDAPPPPLLIVAADCVYWESLFEPLVDTLCELCLRNSRSRGARVLMSHVRRWRRDAKFFKLCCKRGLRVDVLSETMEHVPAEHTGKLERAITRVYLISSASA